MEEPDPIELPINGVLDLHAFRPADAGDLVAPVLAAAPRNVTRRGTPP